MIRLYRRAESRIADEIEARLKEMSLAYQVEVVGGDPPASCAGKGLPLLLDEGQCYSGEEITGYLSRLEKIRRDWDRFQGDSCYCDEND